MDVRVCVCVLHDDHPHNVLSDLLQPAELDRSLPLRVLGAAAGRGPADRSAVHLRAAGNKRDNGGRC